MLVKLFKLEGKNVVLDKPEIAAIKVFQKILRRDRGSVGDTQGREKLKAYAEFAYIYFICDLSSVPNTEGYTDSKAHVWAFENSGLKEIDEGWKIDSLIQEAMDFYKTTQLDTPNLNILRSVKEGINSSSDLIKVMVNKMREYTDLLANASLDEDDSDTIENIDVPGTFIPNPNSASKRLEKAVKLQTEVLKLANSLPKTIAEVKKLEEQVKKELQQEGGIRGDRTLGSRENPN